ncbi:Fis family transcriptional regulator [Stenotrophomonas panacihumi]|uniref:Fis family transcriptional regulator n=1 Tax=Stenotrophomonas panacihumi TaxID=676599 RepID=A0A0R0AH53_9GAMM|nr:sigma-54 dependent transcriptional regulator [Stenotrophomonas panacihumi]KRG41118.1 Fis family transcriptional regulator [Stenotrophomonas panacihumi]PTN54968.1 sigma-54-dependent Fis family transcriptional regulator [Stenotrophomonas panacihumi]
MAAIPDFTRRCVIWFGRPQAQEREMLAAAGWRLRIVERDDDAGIGLRSDDLVVGLVDLRENGADLARVRRLLDAHGYLSLMAVTPAGANDDDAIGHLLDHCIETFPSPLDPRRIVQALRLLETPTSPEPRHGVEALIGDSSIMRATHAKLRKYAPVELPVLVTGETGTGKEVAARAIHELSARGHRAFVAVNCGALPASLVQSELFGHERGAFTGASQRRLGLFETASGGTVFLDEIGDLPLDAQTNLLRVLQEGTIERVGSNQPVKVDVRVLAATHVELEQAVEAGRFRRDLYYRLNVLRLPMPALRERGADIALLAQHFLDRFRAQHTTRARGFTPQALQAMATFDWPGNVRELLNRVQRAAVIAEHELISDADLELAHAAPTPRDHLGQARDQAERDALLHNLKQSQYNVSACARRMQVSRVTVYRLCRKHGVPLEGRE